MMSEYGCLCASANLCLEVGRSHRVWTVARHFLPYLPFIRRLDRQVLSCERRALVMPLTTVAGMSNAGDLTESNRRGDSH